MDILHIRRKILIKWAYATTIFQFILFLVLFVGISYVSMLITTDSSDSDKTIVFKFEKYIVLALSLYMIVPFVLSVILLYGLILKSSHFLTIWVTTSIGTSTIMVLLAFASAVFVIIRGTSYVGYSLLGFSIFLAVLMGASIYLIHILVRYKLHTSDSEFVQVLDDDQNEVRNPSTTA